VEANTLKKTIIVHGETVELYSLDGEIWATDLRQVKRRMEQRAKLTKRALREAKKIFKGGYLSKV
jgi:hypothetical protein